VTPATPGQTARDYFDLPPVQIEEAKPGTRDGDVLQWCEDRLKRGIRFIESQVGYDKIDLAIREIFAWEQATSASYIPGFQPRLSQTRANLIAKIAEDITAQLTDTRCFWNYTTNNARYDKQVRLANKSAEQWYSDRLIDQRIGDVIRYYTFAGTGVAHFTYSRQVHDLMVEAEDPRQVIPIDPLSYHSFQDCAGVIVRKARTPDWVFSEFGKKVRPDNTGLGSVFGWIQRLVEGPGERGGPLTKRSEADRAIPASPTVFVNTMYLRDDRVNKGSKTVRLGDWEGDQPLSTWSYEVRPKEPLFPFKRMIVWAGQVLLYDGPAPYWHAKFPLIKFTLNPWPNSWFGKAPLWDCIPLNASINANLRVVDDHAAKVAQPAIIGDRNVSRAEMAKADSRAPGMKIRTNLASGKGLQIVNPGPLDPLIQWSIGWSVDMMQKIAGTFDPSSLTQLGQLPSDDAIDALYKVMTPGIRQRSRILEGCYREFAEMFLSNDVQWDTLAKRVERFGPSAATPEDFDYAPGTFIPDDVPDGTPGDIAGTIDALGSENPRPLHVRARKMLNAISCKFDASSLLNSANDQELLKYFMLAKMGYCDVFTIWDKMGKLAEFAGPKLNVPDSIAERLALQQALGIGMVANAQGRKATDASPPAIGQTGNGPTITTS
jgi:hypothetical protein